jgi:hypothetical protein
MSLINTTILKRPLRRLHHMLAKLSGLPHLLSSPPPGAAQWLIRTEIRYGGLVAGVPVRRVSPLDPRAQEQPKGSMRGGDRMLHHGYAPAYALGLARFIGRPNLTIAEFGILKGTGLAIWCDLFPDSRILGFDIDLSHFAENRPALKRRGAFRLNEPEVYEYDQLVDNRELLADVLKGGTLDIVIDDGYHAPTAIIPTWRSARPHLSPSFVYFIEDYAGLLDECGHEFEGFACSTKAELTIVTER